MYMSALLACVSLHCIQTWCQQKMEEAPDPPDLELWVVVSNRVGAENGTQILCKRNNCSQLWRHDFTALCYMILAKRMGFELCLWPWVEKWFSELSRKF